MGFGDHMVEPTPVEQFGPLAVGQRHAGTGRHRLAEHGPHHRGGGLGPAGDRARARGREAEVGSLGADRCEVRAGHGDAEDVAVLAHDLGDQVVLVGLGTGDPEPNEVEVPAGPELPAQEVAVHHPSSHGR